LGNVARAPTPHQLPPRASKRWEKTTGGAKPSIRERNTTTLSLSSLLPVPSTQERLRKNRQPYDGIYSEGPAGRQVGTDPPSTSSAIAPTGGAHPASSWHGVSTLRSGRQNPRRHAASSLEPSTITAVEDPMSLLLRLRADWLAHYQEWLLGKPERGTEPAMLNGASA